MRITPQPITFLLAGLLAGALLALASQAASIPTGWIGSIALIAWAVFARRRWTRVETTSGLEPGAPERVLWLRLAGTSLLVGHLIAALLLVGNDLRVGQGNTLAIDSWTMVIAFQVAALLFRRDRHEHDERHAVIAAHGFRVGYGALIATLIPLIAWLAFTPRVARAQLSDFVIANVLIAVLLLSYVALLFIQLLDYARDTHETTDNVAP
jgi:hypothetical protein